MGGACPEAHTCWTLRALGQWNQHKHTTLLPTHTHYTLINTLGEKKCNTLTDIHVLTHTHTLDKDVLIDENVLTYVLIRDTCSS